MKTQILITMVVVSLSVASGLADELKIMFHGDAQKRFGEKIPIEASATRRDGKVIISVENISNDFIAISKDPQRSSINYFSGGKWDQDSANVILCDTELLDHVILRPPKGEKYRRTAQIVCEIPSSHEGDSMAEIKLKLGAYFPSIHDYLEFSVVAKVTLEIERGEQAGADQPATKPADKPPVKDQPSTPTPKDGPR
jgi:hypothetical protein